MKVPSLTHRLTLEAPTPVSDGAGGFREIWQPLGYLWAAMTARAGRQGAYADTPVSVLPYEIVVRAAPRDDPARPQPGQRFRSGDRIFAIQSVYEKDPQGQYLLCISQEELAR